MTEPPLPTGTTPTPSGRERRVWVRHPGSPETPTYCVSEQEDIISWKARIRDISRGGISLVLRSTFPQDAVVDIVFPATTNYAGRKPAHAWYGSEDELWWLVGAPS